MYADYRNNVIQKSLWFLFKQYDVAYQRIYIEVISPEEFFSGLVHEISIRIQMVSKPMLTMKVSDAKESEGLLLRSRYL